ncbi:MAG: toxin-antitoxin system HicB family antitoxin [Planctomycetota bacterium]
MATSDEGDASRASKQRKAFLLRLPPELHEELRRWASAELRSLNGQIEFLLRDAIRRRRGGGRGAAQHDGDEENGGAA